MLRTKASHPSVIVIFGVTGDLANRKLLPALYHLFKQDLMEDRTVIIGAGRRHLTRDELHKNTKESLNNFSRSPIEETSWQNFASHLFYHEMDFNEVADYKKLAEDLEELDKEAKVEFQRIFYFAVPSSLYDNLAENLKKSGLSSVQGARIVVEKPFGRDYNSARILDNKIRESFSEDQIYRIDHYLGKEVVQNIMAFRFANGIFEPIWNRNYIDNIQITMAESIGIEGRGQFYEETGALRDIAQNHLLQLLAHIAMEQPSSLESEAIRSERIRVINDIKPVDPKKIDEISLRGQYTEGLQGGELKLGYRQEEHIAPKSEVETYFVLKLFVDNERFSGVPFYLRHGKRLRNRVSEIAVQFKTPPQHLFETEPNVLTLRIQPDEQVGIRVVAKQPGFDDILTPVEMHFNYEETFHAKAPDAYERLILDVIDGNQMLFIRSDAVENSWKIIDSVREGWVKYAKREVYPYQAGTWGPDEAKKFIEDDKRTWLLENAPIKVGN